jgi:hypothetical protein
VIYVSNDPLAYFSADRGSKRDPMRSESNRATREDATIAARIPPIRQQKFPCNTRDDANVISTFDSYNVTQLHLLRQHDLCFKERQIFRKILLIC